jgi:hypothetical protein
MKIKGINFVPELAFLAEKGIKTETRRYFKGFACTSNRNWLETKPKP